MSKSSNSYLRPVTVAACKNGVAPPPCAGDADSFEFLRAWGKGEGIQVTLATVFQDPQVFGIFFADLIDQIAEAYGHEGYEPSTVRESVIRMMLLELEARTEKPMLKPMLPGLGRQH
jgi:hypothetical protein